MFAVNIGLGHAHLLISPNSLPLLLLLRSVPTPSVFVQFGPIFLKSRYSANFKGCIFGHGAQDEVKVDVISHSSKLMD